MNFRVFVDRIRSAPDAEFGSGATPAEITGAEGRLGVSFRGEYLVFLQEFGWAGIEHVEIFGLGADTPPHLHLVRVTESERTDVGLPLASSLIPVCNDGAGNLYCLDLEDPFGEPVVVFWDHEGQPDQVPEFIDDSFSAWLSGMLDDLGHG